MISRQGREEVPVRPKMDAGAFERRRGRASMPNHGTGEVGSLLHGHQVQEHPRWRPPVAPEPIDASTGPPRSNLPSQLGIPRERRPPSETELEHRRQLAEASAQAFHDARSACDNARSRAAAGAIALAALEKEHLAASEKEPEERPVLRERNRSRPCSRELEDVKADAEKTMLLRDIEAAAADARQEDACDAYLAARAVADKGRSRNHAALAGDVIFGGQAGAESTQRAPKKKAFDGYGSAAGLVSRRENDGIFAKETSLPPPPARGGQNIIHWN
mmetsp:Transcript_69458/g.122849  ORF Transcript_69458/g.122849 Transcript_69458/m.122849 type:complete len:275 (-) Transcript_69458:88-912(-)|eukprot:CAMPEP_0197659112 /NCGR_PEP_ID=MMETSP1338-20131121/46281_1 /TAXON_ID=43686 ORGANISM="Pelagodinium beii, Strain RCC1491" /NCGR_SAMPLE_ID=MMETSP1338 /ASSEMBLY_ACC=CAM_ASM_000754 /LENGTH=274 /DNA_ID=CAMNT_0043235881 /DNA_START=54 /DNA_END=878 /DNA_ORIENTATION=+